MSVCLPVGRSVAHPRRRIDDATIVAVVNAEELFVCSTPFLPFQLCHQHCSVTRKHRFALSFLLVVHIYLRARSLSGVMHSTTQYHKSYLIQTITKLVGEKQPPICLRCRPASERQQLPYKHQ